MGREGGPQRLVPHKGMSTAPREIHNGSYGVKRGPERHGGGRRSTEAHTPTGRSTREVHSGQWRSKADRGGPRLRRFTADGGDPRGSHGGQGRSTAPRGVHGGRGRYTEFRDVQGGSYAD